MPSHLNITILGINYAPERTGIAPYTTRLAEQLIKEGHSVRVITGYPHYPEWKVHPGYVGWRRDEVLNGVRLRRVRHFVPTRFSNLQRVFMELSFGARLVATQWHKPDVVLLVSPALISTAIAMLRVRLGWRRPPAGIWVQDLYSRGLEEMNNGAALSTFLMRSVEGRTLRAATGVSVIHERFKSYTSDSLRVPECDIQVIQNWAHLATRSTIDRLTVRARLGWHDDDVVVLHAGNMGAKQYLDNVISAARLADERNSKVRFVLLGDGNQRHRLENLASGIERVQFVDPLQDDEFKSALESADVLLVNEMKGLREMAVPSKLTSYFWAGMPILAATEKDSTTSSEIKSAKAGIRVEPDSPADLLDAAELLGDDRPLSQELGRSGRAYAESRLSEDTAIIQYSAWLQEMAVTASKHRHRSRSIFHRKTTEQGDPR